MVGSYVKWLSAGASPGLDGVFIPFLKHACLPIERGWRLDHVNVLMLVEKVSPARGCLCGLGRRMWSQLECMQAKCGALSTLKRARNLQLICRCGT
eukprot:453675-Pelagomonas_calceolata.AAC.1